MRKRNFTKMLALKISYDCRKKLKHIERVSSSDSWICDSWFQYMQTPYQIPLVFVEGVRRWLDWREVELSLETFFQGSENEKWRIMKFTPGFTGILSLIVCTRLAVQRGGPEMSFIILD